MHFDGRLVSGITVLLAVIETGNFSRAAGLLGLSASGVSRTIQRLEERLGVRLLDRTTRILRLTSEGSRLYESSLEHIAGLQDAANIAANAAEAVTGHLKVGLSPLFSRRILAPQLRVFAERHPDLKVTIVNSRDVGDLISEGLDVAVRLGPQPSSAMQSRLLYESSVLTVASPEYIRQHGTPVIPEELSHHNCIQVIDPRTNRPVEWTFTRDGETLEVATVGRLSVSDLDTMISACVASAGIAQVLELGTEDLIRDGKLVEVLPEWKREKFPLYALRPSRRFAPAKADAFLAFCSEILLARFTTAKNSDSQNSIESRLNREPIHQQILMRHDFGAGAAQEDALD